MSRIEKVEWKDGRPAVDPQDETILTNKLVPKSWKCPHCGKRNRTGHYADEILMENFKYLEHCPLCDNKKCVRGSDRCEAERWAKRKKEEKEE